MGRVSAVIGYVIFAEGPGRRVTLLSLGRLGFLSAAFLMTLLLVGCSSSSSSARGTSPSIAITTPENGGITSAGVTTIFVVASNFDLNYSRQSVDVTAVEPRGHVIFYLDSEPPTTPGEPATTQEGTYAVSDRNYFQWADVPAGDHTFSAQLVDEDDMPLSPPAVASVQVTATPGGIAPGSSTE